MARSNARIAAARAAPGKPAAKARQRAGGQRRKAKPGASDQTVKVSLTKAVKANLGEIRTLAQFLSDAGQLSVADRLTIIEQALIMIDQTYVHLPLKRAMHAVDPVQRLRLVKQRAGNYTERAFHNEMILIFVHLRDLHTNYILPEPYRSHVAFLPFHIEECFKPSGSNKPRVQQYVVTEVSGTLSDPDFKPGVVVTHWNGIPIDTAVQINAEREAGSNLDARHLQGLQSMTNRWMGMSLPPDEEWVVVRYLPATGAGAAREARFDWQVFRPPPAPGGGGGSVPGADRLAAGDVHLLRVGIDAKAEMQRRVRKLLFAPDAVSAQHKMAELGSRGHAHAQAFHARLMAAAMTAGALAPELGAAPRRLPARRPVKRSPQAGTPQPGSAAEASALAAGAILEGVDLSASSVMPDVIKQFGKVSSSKGTFGYIRIVTFAIADVVQFIGEFIRIAALLPQEGLILDVRGNGGGTIAAGEGLLQLLGPQTIEPERFHLINTPLTLLMCQQGGELDTWRKSAEEGVQTGATFTQGFPLTPPDFCNSIGQVYQGPVLLIIDAGCYSTTDMFAAGFQDHNIGFILGSSGHTGAGGANVWEHTDLEQTLPADISPFKPVPGGASFRVAIRRSTRVGERSGEPLEDLGVVPDEIYQMTPKDVLQHNTDLIAHACEILAGMDRQRLVVTASRKTDGLLAVTAVTSNLQRVDLLLNGRTIHSLDVKDGTTSFDVAAPGPAAKLLEGKGFRNDRLVASTRVQL